MPSLTHSCSLFVGERCLTTGSLQQVALAAKEVNLCNTSESVLVFDNDSGRVVDIDTRGTDTDILARLGSTDPLGTMQPEDGLETNNSRAQPRGRGRPRLGVVAREVTLLPRHWAWLADQPGGASVALRKLVERARKESVGKDRARAASERAYNFMLAIAGDFPGFEEASRALFAGDREKFEKQVAHWPGDIRNHLCWLAFGRVRVLS